MDTPKEDRIKIRIVVILALMCSVAFVELPLTANGVQKLTERITAQMLEVPGTSADGIRHQGWILLVVAAAPLIASVCAPLLRAATHSSASRSRWALTAFTVTQAVSLAYALLTSV